MSKPYQTAIANSSPEAIGEIGEAFVRRMGELGREGRLQVIEALKADRDPDIDEGLAQLEDVIADMET